MIISNERLFHGETACPVAAPQLLDPTGVGTLVTSAAWDRFTAGHVPSGTPGLVVSYR